MIVKDLLLNALANAGHIHEGDTAEADDLSLALRKFNFELRRLSNRNLITAYQKVFDIDEVDLEQTIGKVPMKRGKRLVSVLESVESEKPSTSGYVRNRDYIYIKDIKEEGSIVYSHWQTVSVNGAQWVDVSSSDTPCESVPDIIVNDMERVVTTMFRNSYGQWEKLRFVPLSQFYSENDDYIYCTAQDGENRIRLFVTNEIKCKPIRCVYNTAMDFGKFDVLDLPDAHLNLMEIAVTVALLTGDADSDPKRLENYSSQLNSIIGDITSNTSSERRIVRSNENVLDSLRSGSFILRRSR